MDESQLYTALELKSSDPKKAAMIAGEISDPDLQRIALVTVAPSYRGTDASQATSWVKSADERLAHMEPSTAKLRLTVALCRSYLAEKKTVRSVELMNEGFDLGEHLFEQYMRENPGAMAYTADRFDALQDLTQLSVKGMTGSEVPIG